MTDSKLLRIMVVNSLVAAEGADAAEIEQADRARTLRISVQSHSATDAARVPNL